MNGLNVRGLRAPSLADSGVSRWTSLSEGMQAGLRQTGTLGTGVVPRGTASFLIMISVTSNLIPIQGQVRSVILMVF
jgi:hypothetical protein